MMVDPMFIIVQSLRSFLIAVTTTAVAQIAVIFTCTYLNIYLNFLNLPIITGIFMNSPEFTRIYMNLPKFT